MNPHMSVRRLVCWSVGLSVIIEKRDVTYIDMLLSEHLLTPLLPIRLKYYELSLIGIL